MNLDTPFAMNLTRLKQIGQVNGSEKGRPPVALGRKRGPLSLDGHPAKRETNDARDNSTPVPKAESIGRTSPMKASASLTWILWIAWVSCPAQDLVIALYDYSDLSAKEMVRLTKTADLAFGHSGIHAIWRQCHGALATANRTACEREMKVNEITVRLQSSGLLTSIDDRMGDATVNAAGGYNARVFVRTVRAQAAGFGLASDLLMGYVVAHEVGHCLLGPGHSHAGLMRGMWNRNDAGEMSRLSLHLTKQEARKAAAHLTLAGSAANK
jgi:hypothetical protein